MFLSDHITPKKEEFLAMLQAYPKDEKVVMINILKFKDKTEAGNESGQEAYMRYSKNMLALLEKAEGKVIWSGKVTAPIIGDQQNVPHMVILVEYPSINNFVNMSSSDEYKIVGQDRKIALEYGGLYAASTLFQGQ